MQFFVEKKKHDRNTHKNKIKELRRMTEDKKNRQEKASIETFNDGFWV